MPKARVLAVDDQRYFRELLEGLLTEEGFEAQVASSGEEALRILEQSHFDVVVTDLVMPGMDGGELVHRIKERDPDQDVIVVTGVVDVKTAVEAMKLGANDYLLKPFDRSTLTRTLESLLQDRRLKGEHARLLAENIEYLGERSLFERALRLFGRLSVPPLAEEIVEGLCVETEAQRGVIWVATPDGPLELAAARGLVRVDEEPEQIDPAEILEPLRRGPARVTPADDSTAGRAGLELLVVLRWEGRVVALVRLGDKLGGETFDPVDLHCAERFAGFAETALANAMRFRALERRTLQDAATGAYIHPYFEDAARHELEKAQRFGRSLSLLSVDLGRIDALRLHWDEAGLEAWLARVADTLREPLRSMDLLATDGAGRFWALLPEADALGAALLKERAREMLEASELLAMLNPSWGVRPELATATFPGDGTQLESLVHTLDERRAEFRKSRARIRELGGMSFAQSLRALLQQGRSGRAETASQIARFVLDEVARRPGERRLLFLAPGESLAPTVAEGLGALRGIPTAAEIAVVAEGERPDYADADVAWIGPERAAAAPPFLVHYGAGPPYALVSEEAVGGRARLFHTEDRSLVEHLALRLQRELGIRAPVEPGAPEEGA